MYTSSKVAARVLVVDDCIDDYDAFAERAKQASVPVLVERAADAETALALLCERSDASGRKLPFEYVVVDLNLPRMSGLQLVETLRQHPSLRGLPLVVLTTTNSDRERAACFAAGANAFHVKPVAYQSYREMIDALMGYWTNQTRWRSQPAMSNGTLI